MTIVIQAKVFRRVYWVSGVLVAAGLIAFTWLRPHWTSEATVLIPDQQVPVISGLIASVAAQSGLDVGTQTGALEFLRDILTNEAILSTVTVAALPSSTGAPRSLKDYYGVHESSIAQEAVLAARRLRSDLSVAINVSPATLDVHLTLRDSLLTREALRAVLAAADSANRVSRLRQATEVRESMENQVAAARSRLRHGEDSLESFLVANRSVTASPVLQTRLARLTRSVDISRQWLVNLELQLAQAQYAEAQQIPTIAYVVAPTDPVVRDLRSVRVAIALALLLVGLQAIFWYRGARTLEKSLPDDWTRFRNALAALSREDS